MPPLNLDWFRFRRTANWNLSTSLPVYRRPWYDLRRWFWVR